MSLTHRQHKHLVNQRELIHFQLLAMLCFFGKRNLSNTDLDLLIDLALLPDVELSLFCEMRARSLYPDETDQHFYKRVQAVRNRLVQLCKKKLVVKTQRDSRRYVGLSPVLLNKLVLDTSARVEYHLVCRPPEPTVPDADQSQLEPTPVESVIQ